MVEISAARQFIWQRSVRRVCPRDLLKAPNNADSVCHRVCGSHHATLLVLVRHPLSIVNELDRPNERDSDKEDPLMSRSDLGA
jgi:hypothetical protein